MRASFIPFLMLSLFLIADKRLGGGASEATLSSMLASHHAAAAANPFNMGYPFVSPYPTYSNGDPLSMVSARRSRRIR